ncbi:MAG TPA: riboflavin biosynthesis protein RibF [Clostridiales bacterium]|nr:riboflavin biosynthesis protein RibF [Clostridiales bacterium]
MGKGYIFGLGFFDSVHIGHQNIIDTILKIAKDNDLIPGIITFDDDFYSLLNNPEKNIYLSYEREKLFHHYGINKVITLKSSKILSLDAKSFFEKLLNDYNVKHIVVGEDFRFGKDQKDASFLEKKCSERGIKLNILPLLSINGRKIASTTLRTYLKNGDIKTVTNLLNRYFSINGLVVTGRQEGRNNKLNTANITINDKKTIPQSGVYVTVSELEGHIYKSVTHIGKIPTYNIDSFVIETHIFNFNLDIYNKNLKLYFVDRIRDVKAFENKSGLYNQIYKDIHFANEIKINEKYII